MSDIFISYSTDDEKLARFLKLHLESEGVSVFLASTSISSGSQWGLSILENLSTCKWVLFLASRTACKSAFVQQELGFAIGSDKKLVPVTLDIDPSELPGWVSRNQALDIRGASSGEVIEKMKEITDKIKIDRNVGLLVGLLLVAGLVYLYSKA